MCKRCLDPSDAFLGKRVFSADCECECKNVEKHPLLRGYDICNDCDCGSLKRRQKCFKEIWNEKYELVGLCELWKGHKGDHSIANHSPTQSPKARP